MNIALVLTHNKGDTSNAAQIALCQPFIKKVFETITILNKQTKEVSTEEIYHYEIAGLPIPHQLKTYQIIPFGVTRPVNLNTIDSHNVFYGRGDEDKTGDHPRFFNWGIKRATDYGADIVIYLSDVSQFDLTSLAVQINTLSSRLNTIEYMDTSYGRATTVILLRKIGQLDENMSMTNAISNLKQKILQGGLQYG